MKVKALQSIGKHLPDTVIDVVSDTEFSKLIKDGKQIDVLSQSRVDELADDGAVEVIEDDKPTTKPTAKTTPKPETVDKD